MVRHAQEGLKVAYIGHTLNCARDVQRRVEDRGAFAKTYRGHGQESIHYDSGGSIHFLSAGKNSARGFVLDVLVWDDVQKPLPHEALYALAASPRGVAYVITAEE